VDAVSLAVLLGGVSAASAQDANAIVAPGYGADEFVTPGTVLLADAGDDQVARFRLRRIPNGGGASSGVLQASDIEWVGSYKVGNSWSLLWGTGGAMAARDVGGCHASTDSGVGRLP
jgi:hypothetical protein